MKKAMTHRPTPRDLFECKIIHQFGVSGGLLRALGELHYPGKG